MSMEITNEQLKDFVTWYRWHYRKEMSFEAALQMSMMGHFHITVKQTRPLIQRCLALGYIQKAGNAYVRIMV